MASRLRPGVYSTAAWLAGPLMFLILEAVAAEAFRPSYSYAHMFISELGVPSASPRALLMNTAFCVQGTLFLVGALFLDGTRLFLALVGANAIGNVLVAIFHSGVAPHAVGAVLAIVGGNAAILAGAHLVRAAWYRWVSLGLATVGLLGFGVFVVELNSAAVLLGVWERCSVYSILTWQMFTAVWILRYPRDRWSRLDS